MPASWTMIQRSGPGGRSARLRVRSVPVEASTVRRSALAPTSWGDCSKMSTARRTRSGGQRSSESRNATRSTSGIMVKPCWRDSAAPRGVARSSSHPGFPWMPNQSETRSGVSSLDPSSITMSRCGGTVWARTESRVSRIRLGRLRTGITTPRVGRWRSLAGINGRSFIRVLTSLRRRRPPVPSSGAGRVRARRKEATGCTCAADSR